MEKQKPNCPFCTKPVDVTRYGKIAPHNKGNTRCSGSGRRTQPEASHAAARKH